MSVENQGNSHPSLNISPLDDKVNWEVSVKKNTASNSYIGKVKYIGSSPGEYSSDSLKITVDAHDYQSAKDEFRVIVDKINRLVQEEKCSFQTIFSTDAEDISFKNRIMHRLNKELAGNRGIIETSDGSHRAVSWRDETSNQIRSGDRHQDYEIDQDVSRRDSNFEKTKTPIRNILRDLVNFIQAFFAQNATKSHQADVDFDQNVKNPHQEDVDLVKKEIKDVFKGGLLFKPLSEDGNASYWYLKGTTTEQLKKDWETANPPGKDYPAQFIKDMGRGYSFILQDEIIVKTKPTNAGQENFEQAVDKTADQLRTTLKKEDARWERALFCAASQTTINQGIGVLSVLTMPAFAEKGLKFDQMIAVDNSTTRPENDLSELRKQDPIKFVVHRNAAGDIESIRVSYESSMGLIKTGNNGSKYEWLEPDIATSHLEYDLLVDEEGSPYVENLKFRIDFKDDPPSSES